MLMRLTRLQDLPIQRKMLVMTLLICGAVLGVATAALFAFQVYSIRANLHEDTATLAQIIAGNATAAVGFEDPKTAKEILSSLKAKTSLRSAVIARSDGTVLAEFPESVGTNGFGAFLPAGRFGYDGGYILYTQPIRDPEGKVLGMLYLRAEYQSVLVRLLGWYGLVVVVVVALSIALAALLTGRLQGVITHPVLALAHTAQLIAENQDYSVRAKGADRRDELGQLNRAFNQMLGRIEDQDQALKESQERYEVAIAGVNDGIWDWNLKTNEVFYSPQWKHMLGYSDEEIGNDYAAWESLLHPEDVGPTLAILRDYLEGRRAVYEVEFRMRTKSGEFRWILARGAALRHSDQKPYRMAGSHTDVHGRKQAEAEVLAARRRFETLVNSLDGIVWECQASTLQFTFVSRQSERLLGYAPEQWMANPTFWQEHLHPQDAERAIQTCREVIAKRQPYGYEYRMIAADGRAVWIRESGDVLVQHDQPVLVRGIFQDITEQKRAAEELARLNRELVDTSRQTGMAEVATGVLHNVGNVLNSVNVSCTLVVDRVRHSRVANLTKVAAMLEAQNGSLAEFLTHDRKGRKIPAYLCSLAPVLMEEQSFTLKELHSLRDRVDHIKEIVAMQQSYAKVSGIIETLPIIQLVEDAISLNTGALARHGVTVQRQFEHTPLVATDKHKVLQILLNLIRNAKHACEAGGREPKLLTLRVVSPQADLVQVQVIDNGVGIPPENLTKIFAHGFTTRPGGHGFGLHSGALAASELGGQLSASSEGSGRGATFTLELPLKS